MKGDFKGKLMNIKYKNLKLRWTVPVENSNINLVKVETNNHESPIKATFSTGNFQLPLYFSLINEKWVWVK